MQAILDAIYGKTSGSALASAVGGRIYPDRYPPELGDPVFPYVVFFIVSDVPEYPGGKTIEDVLIQFSIFSASSDTAEINAILANLRTLFDDCSLTITGSTLIYFIRGLLNTMTEEVETSGGTVGVRHYSQEYEMNSVK